MAKITKDEVIKLAQLSRIEILENEIESVQKQVEDVLSYAAVVQEVAKDVEVNFGKNVNVFAKDEPIKCDPEQFLALAPEHTDHFFVVPKIIEEKN